jgi:hypothetical protein
MISFTLLAALPRDQSTHWIDPRADVSTEKEQSLCLLYRKPNENISLGIKINIFWDVTTFSLVVDHERFGGKYFLYFQGRSISQASNM